MARLDPRQAIVNLQQAVARAPAEAAERAARIIRGASHEQLEQLMRSPLRRIVLEAIFWQMPRRIDKRKAAGTSASVRWEITGRRNDRADLYQLELDDGRCQVIRGGSGPDPQVTITLDGAEFLLIATGGSDPMSAYFSGRVVVAGDIMAAAKLGSVFVIPGGRS
jgi:putative sterol carrier protein